MQYSLEVEFIGAPSTIELLSLTIKCSDKRSFYAEFKDFNKSCANDYVKENILPTLKYYGKTQKTIVEINRFGLTSMFASKDTIAKEVKNFFGDEVPEFEGTNAKYAWIIFSFLFGPTDSFPEEWPTWCINFKADLAKRVKHN